MFFNWFWATDSSEIGRSLLDFFSFGHICFGIVVFALLSMISTLRNFFDPNNFKVKKSHWLAFFIGTIIVAIFWEIVENTLLYQWGMKYANRLDSPVNAIFDILLGVLGALICCGFAYLLYYKVKKCEFPWFYLFCSLSFILFFVIYSTLEY
jgi:hypothetical protein